MGRSAPARDDDLKRALVRVVGAPHLLVDPDLCAGYETDITQRYSGRARAVARPACTSEVAAVIAICRRHGVAIVPQGGNTGLVGGSVPRGGEIVVHLGRLDDVGSVDAGSAQITVGAGVTLAAVHAAARSCGFDFPIDHGARSAATIGGMVATNAGGTYAVRFGTMRAQVAGLEFVTGTGSIVDRTAGLMKDNAGYDTTAMVIGSEGTLGLVTRARLRLIPLLPHRVTALFAFSGLEEALVLLQRLRHRCPSLVAADFFLRSGLELVCEHRSLPAPFADSHEAFLVVECAAATDPTDELAFAVEDGGSFGDVAVASDAAQREALWAYRELHNEVANSLGVPHKADVTVRISDVPAFVHQVDERIAAIAPDAYVMIYGHLGDGNVHVNVVGPSPDDYEVDKAILSLVAAFDGSISAEHGVGIAKARYLELTRSRLEIDLMRRVKYSFDPGGILNPGCVFQVENRSA